jgi:hypothetical protein
MSRHAKHVHIVYVAVTKSKEATIIHSKHINLSQKHTCYTLKLSLMSSKPLRNELVDWALGGHVSHLCMVTQCRGGVGYLGGYLNYFISNGFMPSLTNIFVVVVVFGVSGLGGWGERIIYNGKGPHNEWYG